MDVLDLRELNRATLARQCLLERRSSDVAGVVRDCGGIQAQGPSQAAIGLWARIRDFAPTQLVDAAIAGTIVRGTTLRGTLHLHDVEDYRAIRMTLQPMLDTFVRSMRRRLDAAAIEPALEHGRALIERSPLTVAELKRTLAEQFPGEDPQALGNVVRLGMPLLVVPDADARAGWRSNVAPFTPATELIGGMLEAPNPELLARRFFEALGPGTVADAQTWSGMRGLKAAILAMRDRGELIELTTFEGDTLLDLPDAPRPDGETPAAVRFLPMWDNLLLSHKDRSRIIDPAYRPYLASRNGMPPPTYLVDGFVHGTWRVTRSGDSATLQLAPFAPIPEWAQEPLLREGDSLLRFLEPDAGEHVVQLG